MKSFKIPSRNRKKSPEEMHIITCPYCGRKFDKDTLIEDTEDEMHDYYMFMNEMIVHCDCDIGDFIPFVMRSYDYTYSGHCKTKDKKMKNKIKNKFKKY